MAYRQPGVRVFQNFTGVAPALALFSLPNINIGPAFQVVAAQSAGTYNGSSGVFVYPGQIAGTTVDTRAADPTDLISYPIAISLSNTVISYLTGTVGAILVGNLNQFTDATSNIFQHVVAGDVIIVTGSISGNNGSYTVRQVVSNNVLQTNETFSAAETALAYTVRRNLQATVGTISLPTSTSGVSIDPVNGVTLPAGLTATDPVVGSKPIVSATVLLSYRAQRFELSAEAQAFDNTLTLQSSFGVGQIVPENPLAFAAFLALNNGAPETNVLALDFNYLTNELLAYSDAFAILENEDMYALNVLTQSPSVATALNAHVIAMSTPGVNLERVGITNHALITTSVVVDQAVDGAVSGGGHTAFASASATFLTSGVVPGMFVNISAPSNVAGRFQIASVNSQTSITLVAGPTANNTGITFVIDKNLSLDDQAAFLAGYASSIASRRLVVVWPDTVKIPVGPNIRPLPGYFLGAGLGALTTALPTQQGFTNQNVAVYTGVVHSSKYFSNTQLNVIAGGGVMIFAQNILDVSAVFIRHQLTTDLSAIKFQEFSITKNVDFIAKFIRNNHQQFPGKYNIVDNAFDDLKTSAAGMISFLKDSTKLPKIGGVIKSGSLTSAIQDPANIDGIVEQWSLNIPIPLNNLDITINV